MEVIDNYKNVKLKKKQAVTIGVFDGFHIGHQKIVCKTIDISNKFKLEPTVITFEPVTKKRELLTTNEEKLHLFEKAGFKRAIILKNDKDWKDWGQEEFVESFLFKKLNTHCLVIGEDFKFGKNRCGDIKTLGKYVSKKFELVVAGLKKLDGEKVSSSYIRKLIVAGKIELASTLLGRNYFFTGHTTSGRGIGRKIGYPTINFKVAMEKLLPLGVFSSEALFKNQRDIVSGACFIGHVSNSKLQSKPFQIEIHLFNYKQGMEKDIYGAKLIRKIREPEKFKNLKELNERIQQDINEIRQS